MLERMRSLLWSPLILLVFLSTANASLFNELRVVETNYTYTVESSPLEVSTQGIVLRTAMRPAFQGSVSRNEQVPMMATREYHLEIVYALVFLDRRRFVRAELYIGNDLLESIDLTESGRLVASSLGRRYDPVYLSINLEGIPITALDAVDRINFTVSSN